MSSREIIWLLSAVAEDKLDYREENGRSRMQHGLHCSPSVCDEYSVTWKSKVFLKKLESKSIKIHFWKRLCVRSEATEKKQNGPCAAKLRRLR